MPWLAGWLVTRKVALVVRAGEPQVMSVCYDNHMQTRRWVGTGSARSGSPNLRPSGTERRTKEESRP